MTCRRSLHYSKKTSKQTYLTQFLLVTQMQPIDFLAKLNNPSRDSKQVMVFTLSTCLACQRAKSFLTDRGVAFDYVEVDHATEAEEDLLLAELRKYNSAESFPTIIIGPTVVVGYKEKQLTEALQNL